MSNFLINEGGIEIRGSWNDTNPLYPTLKFSEPTKWDGYLMLKENGSFYLYAGDGTTLGTLNAANGVFTRGVSGLSTTNNKTGCSILARGTSYYPSVGFEYGNYGANIQIRGEGDFRFVNSDGINASNITAGVITGNKVYNAVWNDYAEAFEKKEETFAEAGDIIGLAEGKEEWYEPATNKNAVVVGVYSDTYGHLIGGEPTGVSGEMCDMSKYVPVGLAGRVYVKVQGNICKGDYICTSDIAGIGKKYESGIDKSSHIVGISLEDKTDNVVSKIKMFISHGGGR